MGYHSNIELLSKVTMLANAFKFINSTIPDTNTYPYLQTPTDRQIQAKYDMNCQ